MSRKTFQHFNYINDATDGSRLIIILIIAAVAMCAAGKHIQFAGINVESHCRVISSQLTFFTYTHNTALRYSDENDDDDKFPHTECPFILRLLFLHRSSLRFFIQFNHIWKIRTTG